MSTGYRIDSSAFTGHENSQIDRANSREAPAVMFVHGLWLLPSSWDRWAALFENAGFSAVMPGWPDDPETVADGRAHPEAFANKTVAEVADHFEAAARRITRPLVVIGHSFGGLIAQILAGRGCAAATIAIDPAPFRGVLPLPLSALRSAWPVLSNPANRHRAIPLTFDEFRFAFANAVSEEEAKSLYDEFAVPAAGAPLFQAAFANLNPWTEVKVDVESPNRGPLLVISGEMDNTVPRAIAHASFEQQQKNRGVTEFIEMQGRGHALTIDNGWREVAETALKFAQRFVHTTVRGPTRVERT